MRCGSQDLSSRKTFYLVFICRGSWIVGAVADEVANVIWRYLVLECWWKVALGSNEVGGRLGGAREAFKTPRICYGKILTMR